MGWPWLCIHPLCIWICSTGERGKVCSSKSTAVPRSQGSKKPVLPEVETMAQKSVTSAGSHNHMCNIQTFSSKSILLFSCSVFQRGKEGLPPELSLRAVISFPSRAAPAEPGVVHRAGTHPLLLCEEHRGLGSGVMLLPGFLPVPAKPPKACHRHH